MRHAVRQGCTVGPEGSEQPRPGPDLFGSFPQGGFWGKRDHGLPLQRGCPGGPAPGGFPGGNRGPLGQKVICLLVFEAFLPPPPNFGLALIPHATAVG